jgi:GTP diphosphokinase / guanosine-3',5'-bis(diphosphate) 3'-diphosphatase
MKEDYKIESVFDLARHPLIESDKELLQKAHNFAWESHIDQKRKNGDPYFSHVFEVAKNLMTFGMDIPTIAAGYLHDVLEDTEVSPEEMEQAFGKDIVFLVQGVTKLGKIKYQGHQRHVESMRKFFIAAAEDVRVVMIKLADRLHNVSTLAHVRPDKQRRIALETIEIHAALAGRMGMGKLKGTLEDYAFPYAYPKEYEKTVSILEAKKDGFEKTLALVKQDLEKTLRDFDIHTFDIEYRIKHTYSLYKKLVKYDMDIDRIYDIVALRVIVPDISLCYQTLGLIHMLWKPIPRRIKDYIALPKVNGYQSLHTTIITPLGVAEIQIRTYEMHDDSENGIAAHFSYKERPTEAGNRDKLLSLKKGKFAWIDSLKDLQKVVTTNSGDFLKDMRTDFFNDRIFVFTPKSDIVDLPVGSSPLDFAYMIHSDIGNHAYAAKINGKNSALHSILQNGDIVEIDTSKNSHPAPKWINYVKTTSAKKHIRQYIEDHGGLIARFWYGGK